MIFLEQLRGELRKLFARPRTYMGYGAFFVLEGIVLFFYKLDKTQNWSRKQLEQNGLDFSTFYSSLSISFMMILLSMFTLGSIFFALVGGDIVAKENEDGNLRLVFARPITRLRLLLVKYSAVTIYTFSFVIFVSITGYLMAAAAVGFDGGLFVMEPKMKIFSAFPNWAEGATRLGIGAVGIGVSMITLSSIAFMFSCMKIKPSSAAIITLTILFMDMILQNFSFLKPYEEYFVTYRMSAWLFMLEKHIDWAKIFESYVLLGGLNATLFIIGWLAFQTRDFKT
jgi:ABC-2 type transport system permease protein